MDGIDVKNISIMKTDESYIKGARSARNILKKTIRDGIIFSAELIILSILLLTYSGVANTITIGAVSLAIILLVASVITRSIFVDKIDKLDKEYPNKEKEVEIQNKEYVNTSISVLKMGSYTAVVNIITTTISLITVCMVVMAMLK